MSEFGAHITKKLPYFHWVETSVGLVSSLFDTIRVSL